MTGFSTASPVGGLGRPARRLWWKRPFDLVVLALGGVPALLVGLLVGSLVWIRMGRPILFRQSRPGRHGEPFTLVKFRTMVPGAEPDATRLTPFGRWLRSTSLDELPELWNVLRGDMSIVGPRPLLMEYLPLYDHTQAQRHAVRPGVTGWAQVNGRNAQTWGERFALDRWYVEHASFVLDCAILWRTVWLVLRREGIAHPGHSTIERFRGNA